MKIQLINKQLPNCFDYVFSLVTQRDLIIYCSRPAVPPILNMTKKIPPAYSYKNLKFNMAQKIPIGQKIFFCDFDKFSFETKEELLEFVNLTQEISKFNKITGYSNMKTYFTIKNTLHNKYDWNKLKINLTEDCSFSIFTDYMKELEEKIIYRNMYSFNAWILYETEFKQSNVFSIMQG